MGSSAVFFSFRAWPTHQVPICNRLFKALFLEHTYRWLKPGGVLVLVVPAKRLEECKQVLAFQFKQVNVLRLTELESVKYEQVVVFGIRRSRYERDRLSDSEIVKARQFYALVGLKYKQLAPLTDTPMPLYSVPTSSVVQLVYRASS